MDRESRLLRAERKRRKCAKNPPDCDNVLFYCFRDDMIAKARAFFKGKGIRLSTLDRWHEKYGFTYPWSGDYSDLRQNVNRQFVYFPMIIAMCESEHAVKRALQVSVKLQLHVAIRGGSHCMEPFSLGNGTIIDQSRRKKIRTRGTAVSVEPGAVLGEVVSHLCDRNLIMAVGSCPNVGMGYFLGGGVGFYDRTFGAGCDQLKEAKILLASGDTLMVSEEKHRDLLWALRGAGCGNFGIVLSLTFRACKTPDDFYLYKMTYPLDDLPVVLPLWQRWSWEADDRLGAEFRFNNGGSRPLISGIFFGPREELERGLSIFPQKGREDYCVKRTTFAEAGEEFAGKGRWPPFTKAKNSFIDQYLPPAAFPIIIKYMRGGNGLSVFELNTLGGAFNRPAPTDTAFCHRGSKMWMLINAHWDTQDGGPSELEWLNSFSAEMAPFTNGMLYQNMPDLTVPRAMEKYYGPNLPRLRSLKQKYDPDNVFNYAQSV